MGLLASSDIVRAKATHQFDGAGNLVATADASLGVDSDSDGLSDSWETIIGTDPLLSDSDGDGLVDSLEQALGSNPLSSDSDLDGAPDGDEYAFATGILDPGDQPLYGTYVAGFPIYILKVLLDQLEAESTVAPQPSE